MDTPSRRTVLATTCVALAGCTSGDEASQVTTADTQQTTESTSTAQAGFEGVDPLGFSAVPDGVPSPPPFDRTRTYATDHDGGLVDVIDRSERLAALAYARRESGYALPRLRDLTSDGETKATETLATLPSNEAYFLNQLGSVTVVGGHRESAGRRVSWFRSLRDDDTFKVDTAPGTVYSEVSTVDGTLLVAGTLRTEQDSGDHGAVVRRMAVDGTVTWEATLEERGADMRFWTATPTSDGVLAGGSRDNDIWLVDYGPDGTATWRRTVPHESEAYQVVDSTVGPTGTYVVAATNQFATGNNHAAVLSLGPDGTVDWVRVFDPNYEDYSTGPLDLYPRGLVHDGGPVLVGHTSHRVWLAAMEPDGTVRWAGYHPPERDDKPIRALGVRPVGDTFLLYGSTGVPNEAGEDPWLARL